MKKCYLFLVAACLSFAAYSDTHAHSHSKSSDPLTLLVYKTPSCGCCKKWLSHLEEEGITATSKDLPHLGDIKQQFAIQPRYRSCHTAVHKDGYVFEGHVPAKFIQQFISESHPDAIGLSVPAMPVGSPGMEVGNRFMPYKVLILFKDGSSQIYASVERYEEQF